MSTIQPFSLPTYPGATGYNVQYSDPIGGDPNAPNRFGPWTTLTGSPFTLPSNIFDGGTGDPDLRVYRAAPIITLNGNTWTNKYYDSFSPSTQLYDPQITGIMLPYFRAHIGDYGEWQTCSTDINQESGAGTGLLVFDGVRKTYALADIPDAESAMVATGTVTVIKNNLTLLRNTDFWVDYEAGQVTFATAPATTDTCVIRFRQVRYSDRMICDAIARSIETLKLLGVNSFATHYDNNVVTLTAVLGDDGIRALIAAIGLKILQRTMISVMGARARAYKSGDFQMDTVPSRTLEGLGNVSKQDWEELKTSANNYIRTATTPISVTIYDEFFDIAGWLPNLNYSFVLGLYAAWY